MVKNLGKGGGEPPTSAFDMIPALYPTELLTLVRKKSSNITKYFKNGGSQLLTLCELASANSLANLGGSFC